MITKLLILMTEERFRDCDLNTNPHELYVTWEDPEIYGRGWARLYPDDIVMLLELETGKCKHCEDDIQEQPGWILYKWIHPSTTARLCFGQTVNRAEPKERV